MEILSKDTALSVTVGAAIGVIGSVIVATTFVNNQTSRIDSLRTDLTASNLSISTISKKVEFLTCRERVITAAAQDLLADIEQVIVSIDTDYANLGEKMRRQIENQRAKLVNVICP